jgi:hypothetical protein
MSQIEFESDPEDVGRWLRDATEAALRRNFVLAQDDTPETLYLWMNDFPFNTDRWFLAPFGMGPERPAHGGFDWRDALIGDEIGSGLRIPNFVLTGMEPARAWFARPGGAAAPEWQAIVDVVLMAAFDLVARGLRHTGDLPVRIAMSCSEDWRVCVWNAGTDRGVVHTWRPSTQ